MESFRPVASVVWGLHTPRPASMWFVPANARWSFSTSPPERFIAGGVVTENVPALHEQVGVVPENRAINVIAGSAIVSFSRQWEQRQSEKEKERGSLAGCAPKVLLGVFFALRLPRGEIRFAASPALAEQSDAQRLRQRCSRSGTHGLNTLTMTGTSILGCAATEVSNDTLPPTLLAGTSSSRATSS